MALRARTRAHPIKRQRRHRRRWYRLHGGGGGSKQPPNAVRLGLAGGQSVGGGRARKGDGGPGLYNGKLLGYGGGGSLQRITVVLFQRHRRAAGR